MKIKRINLLDISCFLFIASTLSFHDKKIIFIPCQLLFIALTFFDTFSKNNFRLKKITFKIIVWYSVFLLLCAFSYLWSLNTDTYKNIMISIIQTSLLGISMINYIKSKENVYKIIKYITIAGFLLCIRLIVTVPVGAWGSERVGTYIGYGNVGVTYVLAYASLISLIYGKKNGNKRYYLYSIFFLIISSLTGTKKGLLIFLIGFMIYIFKSSKKPLLIIRNGLIFIVVSITCFYLMMNIKPLYNAIGVRFESALSQINGTGIDKSTRDRALLINYSWNAYKSHPIFGIGIDAFRNYEKNPLKLYAHNNYMELLADLGIAGFLIYYAMPIGILVLLLKIKTKDDFLTLISIPLLIAILFGDLTSVSYCHETIQIYLSFTIGIAVLLKSENQKGRSE